MNVNVKVVFSRFVTPAIKRVYLYHQDTNQASQWKLGAQETTKVIISCVTLTTVCLPSAAVRRAVARTTTTGTRKTRIK